MRTYSFLAARPGGFMNWPSAHVISTARIRVVAITLFRKWFGREPNFHWHKDGFMAEARDERGNHVQVEQCNDGPWERYHGRARQAVIEGQWRWYLPAAWQLTEGGEP